MAMTRVASHTVLLCLSAACVAQECQPYWTGLKPKNVGSMIAFDDGGGRSIYVENYWGDPTYIDPVRRWNGHEYVSVGERLRGDGVDNSLRVLDDGNGPKLYCLVDPNGGGTREMFRWPGPLWHLPPPGMFVHPAPLVGTTIIPEFSTSTPGIAGLYAFMFDYSVPGTNQVAIWTGQAWKRLGGCGAGTGLFKMAEWVSPQGPNLVVSGGFEQFAGMPARFIVRWDGQQWHALGDAPGGARSIVSWDDGNGPSLFIGWIAEESQPPLAREGIARWTGTQWESVGGGLFEFASGRSAVHDMTVFDDGTGPALFVLGRFERAGGPSGIPARNIAKWDGQQWHALGAGVGGFPDHLAVADDGRGLSLFVAGDFSFCGGGQVGRICQYVGCAGNRQCYADCDNNRVLTANDFMCFLNKYAARDPYANCDGSTVSPVMTAADFQCFLNKYAQGCSR